jgi:hypothetical protein
MHQPPHATPAAAALLLAPRSPGPTRHCPREPEPPCWPRRVQDPSPGWVGGWAGGWGVPRLGGGWVGGGSLAWAGGRAGDAWVCGRAGNAWGCLCSPWQGRHAGWRGVAPLPSALKALADGARPTAAAAVEPPRPSPHRCARAAGRQLVSGHHTQPLGAQQRQLRQLRRQCCRSGGRSAPLPLPLPPALSGAAPPALSLCPVPPSRRSRADSALPAAPQACCPLPLGQRPGAAWCAPLSQWGRPPIAPRGGPSASRGRCGCVCCGGGRPLWGGGGGWGTQLAGRRSAVAARVARVAGGAGRCVCVWGGGEEEERTAWPLALQRCTKPVPHPYRRSLPA